MQEAFQAVLFDGSESKRDSNKMKRGKNINEKIKKKRKNPYRTTDLPYNADFYWGEHIPGGES